MHLLVRVCFRIAALALKFALTIIVARTLGFAAVADYGLALAISVVSSKLLGLGFSTEINRRLSWTNPVEAIHDARRLLLLYCIAYVVIAVVAAISYESNSFGTLSRISPGIFWGVLLVAFSEHAGLETTSYVFSLHRSGVGALLLFVRTGAWAGVAITGLLAGVVGSIESVFALWYGTNIVTALAAYRCVTHRGHELKKSENQSDHKAGSFRSVWIDGLPFFFATVVISGLQYGERFLASKVFSPAELGRYVFTWSISNSIQTIAYATIVVIAGPRLVRSLSTGADSFRATLRRSLLSSFVITLLFAVAILGVHKPVFHMAHEPAGSREFGLLLVLLVSFMLRSIADVFWVGAVALRLGKGVAVAIFCTAVVSLPIEWLLIVRLGEIGAALAHLTASVGVVTILAFMVLHANAGDSVQMRNRNTIYASQDH